MIYVMKTGYMIMVYILMVGMYIYVMKITNNQYMVSNWYITKVGKCLVCNEDWWLVYNWLLVVLLVYSIHDSPVFIIPSWKQTWTVPTERVDDNFRERNQ